MAFPGLSLGFSVCWELRRAVTAFSRWPWGRDLMTPCSGLPFSKIHLVMPSSLSHQIRLGENDAQQAQTVIVGWSHMKLFRKTERKGKSLHL